GCRHVRVGIPYLERRIDVAHVVRTAPLEDVEGADVPREVDDQIAGPDVTAERLAVAVALDAVAFESRALLRHPARVLRNVAEVDHRVLRTLGREMLEEE